MLAPMTPTTTTTTVGGRVAPLTIPDQDLQAVLLGTAVPIPDTSLAAGLNLLAEVLDSDPTADSIRAALTYPGARNALVTAVQASQHGHDVYSLADSEGDGVVMLSFLSLAIATARLVRAEDDTVDAAGRPDRGGDAWRTYVERCGRIALVRSLRAVYRPDAGPDSRDALYRVPNPDDPAVTAPRAPRTSRSPGAKVAAVPRSRSERQSAEVQRAANVWADSVGAGPDVPGGVPRVLGSSSQAFAQSVSGDPRCPQYGHDGHACSLRCWPLGGWGVYSPRQSSTVRGRQVRAGEMVGSRSLIPLPQGRPDACTLAAPIGPSLSRDHGEVVVWHAFHAFPYGCVVVREHGDTETDSRLPDRGRVRLSWTPRRARQHLTSGDTSFTPTTFVRDRGTETRTPRRTAEHLASGGTFDPDVVTSYGESRFVGWRAAKSDAARPSRQRAARVAKVRRTLTTQQRAVISLVVDAALLVMFDGRPRTAHRDQDGNGYVITRTTDGILSLITPDGITSPLRTDTRGLTADVRTAITT